MAPKIHIALVFHNHQPVGNFDHVFEQAYQEAYKPLLDVIARHPAIKVGMHNTGPLRNWLHANHPEWMKLFAELVQRGQIEPLGGAYYEPILAAIPDADKRGQLVALRDAVASDTGHEPRGMWLAERVWEPHLPAPIAASGYEYTILDDSHFKYVGLDDEDLFGYYVAEEQGETLKLFATAQQMRYLIPWAEIDELLAYLRANAREDGNAVAVMGDDGEKFGHWPNTHLHCYTNGYMDRLFTALAENQSWVETVHLGDFAQRYPAKGRIYLPTASYAEMLQWALPAIQSGNLERVVHRLQETGDLETLRFVRGGFWRNFMVKYPEVNTMHKKMLLVSRKLQALPSTVDGERLAQARDHLWQAQCNCPYWHGVFGGIYYAHIRESMFAHLIAAEVLADDLAGLQRPDISWQDFDRDTTPELLLSTPDQNLYFDPHRGGTLFEWDWRARHFNLLNTMTRRSEAYHEGMRRAIAAGTARLSSEVGDTLENIHEAGVKLKEAGLENYLNYDRYRRVGLIDHFFPAATTPSALREATVTEQGDFVDGVYTVALGEDEGGPTVTFSRDGQVQGERGEPLPVTLHKQVSLFPMGGGSEAGATGLRVRYTIANRGSQPLESVFAPEWNFALLAGHSHDSYYRYEGADPQAAYLDSAGEAAGHWLRLTNEWMGLGIELRSEEAEGFWFAPVETVVYSMEGFERTYQSSAVFPRFPLTLAPGAEATIALEISLTPIPAGRDSQ